jgi:hypothetical protein
VLLSLSPPIPPPTLIVIHVDVLIIIISYTDAIEVFVSDKGLPMRSLAFFGRRVSVGLSLRFLQYVNLRGRSLAQV